MRPVCSSSVRWSRGLTFAELLGILVIAAVALMYLNAGIRALIGKTRESRLHADIRALNHSIYLFRASGGDLSDALTPEQVIAKMQAVENDPMALKVQSILVTGLKPIHQSPAEASSEADRAFWNAEIQLFEISRDGQGGIKWFRNDGLP